MLRYFGVGRSKVPLGAPLRIFALIEQPRLAEDVIERHGTPEIWMGSKTRSLVLLFSEVQESPGVHIRAFSLEIDTSTLEPGAYEIQFRLGKFTAKVEETIWVLQKDTYLAILREEISSANIGPVPFLIGADQQPLTRETLSRIVGCAFDNKLNGFLCLDQRLVSTPGMQISFDQPSEFSGDPLTYVAEVFADQCRDLLLFGAKCFGLSVHFSDVQCRLILQASFEKPLSPLMREHYLGSDFELGIITDLLGSPVSRAHFKPGISIGDDGASVKMSLDIEAVKAQGSGV